LTERLQRVSVRLSVFGLLLLAVTVWSAVFLPVGSTCDWDTGRACPIQPWATLLPITVPLGTVAGITMLLLGFIGLYRSQHQ
jgi:hypothetical protein